MTNFTAPIRLVIWDHDNTLIPTAELHFKKHDVELRKHGIILSSEDYPRIAKNNGRQNWQWLSEERGLSLPLETYLKNIDTHYSAEIGKISFNPGILESITLLNKHGMKQGIVSNARRSSLMSSVKAHHLDQTMDFIWGKEDYDGRKDTHSTYPKILNALPEHTQGNIQAKPENTLFFDDDPDCITAAQQAGIQAVRVLLGPLSTPATIPGKNQTETHNIPNLLKNIIQ